MTATRPSYMREHSFGLYELKKVPGPVAMGRVFAAYSNNCLYSEYPSASN